MTKPAYPVALVAAAAPPKTRQTNYPEPFASHSKQDEFIYILQGTPTLHTDEGSYPGDDLRAALAGGKWLFTRKDGTPY